LVSSANLLKLVDRRKSISVMLLVGSVVYRIELSLLLELSAFSAKESCYKQMFFLLIYMKLFSICWNFFFMFVKFYKSVVFSASNLAIISALKLHLCNSSSFLMVIFSSSSFIFMKIGCSKTYEVTDSSFYCM
jgi:hypothetical protein